MSIAVLILCGVCILIVLMKTNGSAYQLGVFVRKNKNMVLIWLVVLLVSAGWLVLDAGGLTDFWTAKRKAKQGDVNAQYRLARMYKSGYRNFVEKNVYLAVYWHEEAARQGYAKSAYELYEMYNDDFWVPMDEAKASRWLQEAARLGHFEAKEMLEKRHVGNSKPISTRAEATKVASRPHEQSQPRRMDLGGGSYVEYNGDGSTTMVTVMSCFACSGSGLCMACGGAGGRWLPNSGFYWKCPMCAMQPGICNTCKGEGKTTTTTRTDAAGNSYLHSSDGSYAYGNSGGMIMASPDGKMTAVPIGGSSGSSNSHSSYSSRSTCSRCGGRRWDTERYSNCAASTSGAMQPYKNYAGTSCSVCGYSTEHCHYPCSECWGHGTIKN